MAKHITLHIAARKYEDHEDCLAAAAADVAAERNVPDGYDMAPRWADNQRDEILIDVPAA